MREPVGYKPSLKENRGDWHIYIYSLWKKESWNKTEKLNVALLYIDSNKTVTFGVIFYIRQSYLQLFFYKLISNFMTPDLISTKW